MSPRRGPWALERTLVETFDPCYDELLAAARERLVLEEGSEEA